MLAYALWDMVVPIVMVLDTTIDAITRKTFKIYEFDSGESVVRQMLKRLSRVC